MGQTLFDVSTSWIPGSLGRPTLGSIGGGGFSFRTIRKHNFIPYFVKQISVSYEYPKMCVLFEVIDLNKICHCAIICIGFMHILCTYLIHTQL